jgi:tRNA(Arg) A34 adenosine deaminase TadA
MRKTDSEYMRIAIEVARISRDRGNHPYGAILVSQEGDILLTAENTVETERDVTGHAELNLMRAASHEYDTDYLASCSIFTSTEPCPMCAGAIFWGNVRHVVFGLSGRSLYGIIGENSEEAIFLPCRDLFDKGRKTIQVDGPVLEEEAFKVHEDFWS